MTGKELHNQLVQTFKQVTVNMHEINLFELQNVVTSMEMEASSPAGSMLYEVINYIVHHSHNIPTEYDFSKINMYDFQNDVIAVASKCYTIENVILALSVRSIFSQTHLLAKEFMSAANKKRLMDGFEFFGPIASVNGGGSING